MTFTVDPALLSSSIHLTDWTLSRIFLKNDCTYPWLILVPQQVNVREIYELTTENQILLIKEISRLSEIMQKHFQPHKLNVAALGNRVPQLHLHVVARYSHDAAWPYPIWQREYVSSPYEAEKFNQLYKTLRSLLL